MLQRLFIFLLLFLVLPDLYLYLRFIVRLTAKWWLRVLYWVPSFLLTAGLLYLVLLCQQCFCGTPYTGHRVVLYHLFPVYSSQTIAGLIYRTRNPFS